MKNLKIGYNYFEKFENLDPAKIETLNQANLIENLYSRLIEYDTNNELKCVLCSNFEIKSNKIIFEINDNIKTSSGYKIGPKDIELSLHRLYNINTNTHGSLSNFINSENDIKAIENKVEIELKKSSYSQFILPLLASMDFSIIPNIALSKNQIVDYKNTSGPYYLEEISENGEIKLKANKFHPFYNKEMIQDLILIPTLPDETISNFQSNKIDFVDVTNYPRFNIYNKFFMEKTRSFVSSETLPINLFLLSTKKSTLKEFTKEQLFYAYSIISKKYLEFQTYGYGFKESINFFPSYANGHLTEIQQKEILKSRTITTKPTFKKPITLGVLERSFDKVNEKFKDFPEIKIIAFKTEPSILPENDRPDIIIQTTDSSFNEDFSLLSYNFSMNYFGNSKTEGDEWLKNYLNTDEKAERIQKLQDLHYKLLKEGILYPIGASPYWAIGDEKLELNFPKSFPGSHWWKIRVK